MKQNASTRKKCKKREALNNRSQHGMK